MAGLVALLARRRSLVIAAAAWGTMVLSQIAGAAGPPAADGGPEEETEAAGRSFLYKELVLSAFYSPDGFLGVPLGNRDRTHLDFSPRPPENYAAVDYVQTFTSKSFANRYLLPQWLPLTAIDFHPRVVFNRLEETRRDQIKFAPQDLWLRFNPARADRLTLRVGQFVIPYGVNPILAPRQRFILPLEGTDLGLKWDWGIDLKGPLGDYDWEAAATIGTGETIHSPHFFGPADERSYLFTGRVGAPTYWDLQYGFSFLYGDLPFIRASTFKPKMIGPASISRWRIGLDGFYKYGTYLMAGAQLTYGQDGFGGDEEFVMIPGGKTADVLGYRASVDWVLPMLQDLRLAAQFESVIRDLSTSDSDDTAAIFEINYSVLTAVSVMLDYRLELNRSMGEKSDAIFFTFVYYAA